MGVVHESQRQIAIGTIPQTDFLTPTDTADSTKFVRLEVMDTDFGKLTPQVSDNQGDAHGYEEATDQYLESWDAEAPHNLALSSEQAGRILLLLFGAVVTTQPDAAGAPQVYQHVFTPMDISNARQLPATTLIEVVGTALNRKFPSMCMENFSMKGDGMKRIETSFQLRGSGKEITPSGLSVAQMKARLLSGLHYFFNSQATITIADAVTLANAIAYGANRRHNNWEFGWNNQFLSDEGYFPGAGRFQTTGNAESGAVRSELLVGRRVPSGSLNVRFQDQSEEHAALKSRKKLDWKLELTGSVIQAAFKHKLTFQAHQIQYEMVELGKSNGGLITSQIKPKFLVDPASGQWVTATLMNNIPSYTV